LFRKDVRKTENPLVRALAVRSFGCLRVAKLNDYLIEPLKDAVQDEEAYVRKTAVLCVPKVYEVSEELVQNSGLVDMMQKMLHKESNALVLANLVIALKEIGDIKGENLITLNRAIIQKLLLAINECIEWAQIFILDFLA
jgi:AP-1 complex subunit beta-1